ncbi:MAG: ParB N-terminal domain-containing protein [Planctomycetota bacterium]
MKIEQREIEQIRPYEANPRDNDKAVEAVAKSIREFGFRQPIVVDAAGVIVVGHTRWKAARRLGLKTVPVHVAADLTPEQARAYRIADNRLAEEADWDLDLLPIELEQLREDGVELELLGFPEKELAEYLAEFDTDLGDDLPKPADEVATVHCPKCGHEFPLPQAGKEVARG